MFDKLRRAKSFIQKSKHEEEQTQLDLSESSHLRRNISIDGEVLARQKRINRLQEQKRDKRLQRQMSKSHEHLEDQVVEQLRKLNFGDSYSKQDMEFQRRHPAYFSERNFHRRSLNLDDYVDKNKHSYCHRNSGDVVGNFDRNNPAYRSERPPATKPLDTSHILGSDGDFLLNRKSVDMSHNFERRHPAYVSGRKKSGLKSLIDKIVGNKDHSNHRREYSDASSYSGCSTGSSAASFSYEASRRSDHDHSNCSTASSSGTFHGSPFDRSKMAYSSKRTVQAKKEETIFDRSDPAYYSQANYVQTRNNVQAVTDEVSRKRVYNQTKPPVNRSRSHQRCLPEDSRNRTKRDGNTNDRR